MWLFASWARTLTGLALIGCVAPPPKLAAEGSGDLTNPPAPRTDAIAPMRAACGNEELLATDGLLPYVQGTQASSARILVTLPTLEEKPVEITHPDGSPVDHVVAHPSLALARLEAPLVGLDPDTVYCYSLDGQTARAGFRTAATAGSGRPVRFAAFGDSGVGSSYQLAVASQLLTVPFDFLVHTGDLAYKHGTRAEIRRNFFGVYREIVRSFAVFPALGNHDTATEEGAPFFEAFPLPEQASGWRYYSFDWGDVHIAVLDTERIDEPQADWLDRDLAAHAGAWLIVAGHRPPHSSGYHGSNADFRRAFGPVLERNRVSLVLSGHEHNYERTFPIGGVTYVVTGGGGAPTRPVSSSSFTAYSEDVLHFVFVEVEGDVLLLHAIDGVGREFDSARIERG